MKLNLQEKECHENRRRHTDSYSSFLC